MRPSAQAPLVLVVDDYEDTRELYAECLSQDGFETITADDGEQAISGARQLMPDVIVMDLGMPKIDGGEAIRQLKADPATRGIIIIALTGRDVADHGKHLYDVGCDEYLTKPVSPGALGAAIRTALSARGGS